MTNETLSSAFPETKKDLSQLKNTASDALNDLGSTAAAHASTAKNQLQDLSGHFQAEGGEQLERVQVKFDDLIHTARNYAAARPLACIGVALAVGLLFGLSRGNSSKE